MWMNSFEDDSKVNIVLVPTTEPFVQRGEVSGKWDKEETSLQGTHNILQPGLITS